MITNQNQQPNKEDTTQSMNEEEDIRKRQVVLIKP